jgi:hypothetical protein
VLRSLYLLFFGFAWRGRLKNKDLNLELLDIGRECTRKIIDILSRTVIFVFPNKFQEYQDQDWFHASIKLVVYSRPKQFPSAATDHSSLFLQGVDLEFLLL